MARIQKLESEMNRLKYQNNDLEEKLQNAIRENTTLQDSLQSKSLQLSRIQAIEATKQVRITISSRPHPCMMLYC